MFCVQCQRASQLALPASYSFLGCLRSLFPFLCSAAITQLWHLRHLRVSITIEATLFTSSCRDSPATHLLLVAFQRMILQPLYLTAVRFCSRLGLEPGPLQICIHFHFLMFFFVDYHFLSFRRCLRHFIFARHRISSSKALPTQQDTTLFISFLNRPLLISFSINHTSNIVFPGTLFFSSQTMHFVFLFALLALFHCGSD